MLGRFNLFKMQEEKSLFIPENNLSFISQLNSSQIQDMENNIPDVSGEECIRQEMKTHVPHIPAESKTYCSSFLRFNENLFLTLATAASSPPGKLRLLASQIIIGMIRDFQWGLYTFKNYDYFAGEIGIFAGPTVTQLGITLLPMLGAARLTSEFIRSDLLWEFELKPSENDKRYCSKNKVVDVFHHSSWVKKQLALAFASWSTIPVWNAAQYAGCWLGKQLGFSTAASGYFSGIFTGVTETLWQNVLILPKLLGQPMEKTEVILNTLGGAVWQWVLQAYLPVESGEVEENDEIEVGIKIAFAVAISTMLMTLLAWKMQRYSEFSQDESSLDTISIDTDEDESTDGFDYLKFDSQFSTEEANVGSFKPMASVEKKHQPYIDAWRYDISATLHQSGIFKPRSHHGGVVFNDEEPKKIILEYLFDYGVKKGS
jgi:hypothetical protein